MSSSDDEGENYQYKIVVVGDGAVGKSSLIHQYCEGTFQQSYKQTIGLDFFTRRLQLPGSVNVTLQIWDLGGQQIGGKMLKNYIGGSHAIIYVYDVTNPDSFQNVGDWYDFVTGELKKEEEAGGNSSAKRPLMALAGNKMDLPHLRQVKPEKHATFAQDHKLSPFLVSAKTGDRVNGMFTRIAAELSGVAMTKQEVDYGEIKVTAPIVQHSAAAVPQQIAQPTKSSKKDDSICSVQ